MESEKLIGNQDPKGLTIFTASVFLAGEMAGSGVLALPAALTGTGWSGLILILFFSLNAAYIGSRLGLCWELLAGSGLADELKQSHVRDPYPLIAEKAGALKGPLIGKAFRYVATGCIIATLYGGACVFLIIIADFLQDLAGSFAHTSTSCLWMVIAAVAICPLTWFGSPKDFWPIAIGALLTTMTACALASIQIRHDVTSGEVICSLSNNSVISLNASSFHPEFPAPTADGYFAAFGSIMFAFGGASTFPTIQADMADKGQFKWAAVAAMSLLFIIYFPTAAIAYFSLGNCVGGNVIQSMSSSSSHLKIAAESVMLLHLVAALPIVINPPSQYFEEIMSIPREFGWKRCVFRTATMAFLLFVGETVPSFGSILDLVGGSTITCLTFIMPPLLYIFVMDYSLSVEERSLKIHERFERFYCWSLIFIGLVGGVSATITAIKNIVQGGSLSPPCYV